MSLDADTIVDRRRMRRKLTFWRVLAVLIAAALVAGRRHARTPAFELVVTSFVAAPLAAVLLDAPRSAGLALLLVPFAALLGAHGLETLLWRRPAQH